MSFGFIITRHVNSDKTNCYWNQNIKLLRSHYPKCKLVIIDDNSNQSFIKAEFDYINLEVINSEYTGRGELLPYIYYLKHKWFDNAVIIHDSVFFHKTIDFANVKSNVLSLWMFYNNNSEIDNILRISDSLNHSRIIKYHILEWSKNNWVSCFGSQSYINHNFLVNLNNKYKLTNLINVITNRSDRCALERIMGLLFYIETRTNNTLFGCINNSHIKANNYTYSFDEYMKSFYSGELPTAIIKVWTGR